MFSVNSVVESFSRVGSDFGRWTRLDSGSFEPPGSQSALSKTEANSVFSVNSVVKSFSRVRSDFGRWTRLDGYWSDHGLS